ncbi:MAG: PAS domain S-box protein [Desulfobacterales bacterium]|nr:PAS domain S-box protein [Desulfobacterales bacterium]
MPIRRKNRGKISKNSKNSGNKTGEKRREAEDRWRALFESTSDAVFILKKGVYTGCNQKALDMFRCGREEIVGRSPADLSPEKQADGRPSKERIDDELTAALQGEPRLLKWIHQRRSGAFFDAEIRLKEIALNGEKHVLAVVREVAGPARDHEVIIHSEKMMMVGGLAAGVVHEINNSLSGILQNIQIMANRVSGDLPKNRRAAKESGASLASIRDYMERRGLFRMMDSIMKSGVRASKVIDNMLTFSRRRESHFVPRDLRSLLDQTVELARSDFDLKKKYDFRQIEIVREYDPDMPDVPCKGTDIQQVFFNILKNGAHAMAEAMDREGGADKPRFILRVQRDGEMARVELEDNGPGLDKVAQTRLFERLFTTSGFNPGLGMSVSEFIINENHLGELSVKSPPGKGARFVIKLPLGKYR